MRTIFQTLSVIVLTFSANLIWANTLQHINYTSLPGNLVQVTFQLSAPAEVPTVFTTDNPAQVVLDFKDTSSALTSNSSNAGIGIVSGFKAVEAEGRTRVVINLAQMAAYETMTDGNKVHLKLGGTTDTAYSGNNAIRDITFQRGKKGEGLIKVTLPDAKTLVDLRQEGEKLVIDFMGANLPARLQRKLDVTDFATPVFEITTMQKAANTEMEVKFDGLSEHLAYQSNEEFVIEVKPLAQETARGSKNQYTGEKLSLNFQDIEVRSVLQLLADFTGFNVVVSDNVGGNITLRLKNVPWDQALDIILRTKGLAKRQTNNVMLIAPAAEIANAERLELEAAQQFRELAPLSTEFIPVNYANAADIAGIIDSEEASLLSDRGSVAVDPRTNTLLVRETASNITQVREFVAELDIPVSQVLIESRVVSATDDFSKSLGVRFGYSRVDLLNSSPNETPFTAGQGSSYSIGGALSGLSTTGAPTFGENLIVDLPASSGGASIGLAVGKVGSDLLQLELSAMQEEGRGEVISNPRLVTADKSKASIKTGVQIPYQQASSSGATTTAFQDAVLSLDVTPQITPDERVIMDLAVNRDTVSSTTVNGVPAVNTQSLTTQVIVDNGETVVLGGVYERTISEASSRVPFLGDLPFVGWAFRNKLNTDNKAELLIFVTPRILNEDNSIN